MTDARQGERTDAGARVVAAAVALVRDQGVAVGLDRISLEQAITASGVSRATAYRRWPSRRDFLCEVLIQVVRQTRLDPETEEDVVALRQLADSQRGRLATEEGRRDFVVESFRLASESDYRRLAQSREWRDHLALRATCASLPAGDVRDRVTAELGLAEQKFAAHRATVYSRLPALLGYRLVPWLDAETGFTVMAAAAGALMTGLVVRPGFARDAVPFRACAFGSSIAADWTVESYALVALILSYLEPDPQVSWDESCVRHMLGQWEALEQEVVRLRERS